MFSSPNSFSITAIFWPWASVSTRLSSVVLPEPRKPVRMVAGIRAMAMMRLGVVGEAVGSGAGRSGRGGASEGGRLCCRGRRVCRIDDDDAG